MGTLLSQAVDDILRRQREVDGIMAIVGVGVSVLIFFTLLWLVIRSAIKSANKDKRNP